MPTDTVKADMIHSEAGQRHGDYYQTPGYYLRLYRNRTTLTQLQMAEKLTVKQHHISEMERNKRPIGKALTKKFEKILNCDYR